MTTPDQPIWYVNPVTWNVFTKTGRISCRVTYLLRGVNDITVFQPTVYLAELGLVLKRKLMGDDISHRGIPFDKLIRLGKPFCIDICEELDLVGISIVGGDLDTKVRERN